MKEYDVIVIGGGPGGYAAAVRAAGHGLTTALIEREKVGGTCVNWGCIPTKALLKYAKRAAKGEQVDYETAWNQSMKIARERSAAIRALLERLGVDLVEGSARLADAGTVEVTPGGARLRGRNIVVATGSRARRLPIAEYDGTSILTTRDALELKAAPASAVVVGSGATGMEFATVWSRFGAKVTVLEMMPHIMGSADSEITETARRAFAAEGVEVRTQVSVQQVRSCPAGVEVTYLQDGQMHTVTAEKALLAAGILPNTEELGLEELGLELQRGYIPVDEWMATALPGVYAIGDVTGKVALAFTASLQAMTALDHIAGRETRPVDYAQIPRCIYAGIEVAAVGLNESQAAAAGHDVVTVKHRVTPYVKEAAPAGDSDYIKLFADRKSGVVLGAIMVGSDAADQIAVPVRMIRLGATVEQTLDAVCNRR